ncbi:response regulator transcription factor [Candidatus Pacearchaeota archaeon]|nr:response regulator transcription factor [Candidatus Pacearchaeota archaeon]
MENKNQKKFGRMLVVEDNKDYLAGYKFALERQCKILDLATNEKDALEFIAENEYNAVITDGAMPEYDGAYLKIEGAPELKDYRGKNIAKVAKEKGAYVIGISAEPEKLDCESIDVLMKKPYDVLKLFQVLALQPTREEFNINIAERRYE